MKDPTAAENKTMTHPLPLEDQQDMIARKLKELVCVGVVVLDVQIFGVQSLES